MSMKTDTYVPKHLKRWQLPQSYIGAHWPDYYVFLGRHRDSDCLTNSNFECGLKAVQAVAGKEPIQGPVGTVLHDEDGEAATVRVVSENHWAVGWVEWIAIHESDSAALECADQIMERLDDYPVVDEQDWSERESKEADEVWKSCYRPHERVEYIRKHRSQFEFRGFADLLACVRGKYFAGYASELLN